MSDLPRQTPPFAPFEWMIALRYLRPKRKESYISVISILSLLGIMIGVAALIIVMSVMNGFRAELLGKILGVNGHAIVQSYSGSIRNFDALAGQVRGVAGVTRVYPMVEGQVMAASSGTNAGVDVRGVRAEDLTQDSAVANTLSDGALAQFRQGDSVILGWRLADALRIVPGGSVTLIAPRGNVTPFGVTPRIKTYRVAGTVHIGMSEYDKLLIFMPLKEAQLFFNTGEGVSGLEVMVKNPDAINAIAGDINRVTGPDTRVLTWEDMNSSLVGAITVEKNVMFLILSLIILVAALNIISGLVMLVKDKGADIAILRTMGASRGAIMRIFLIAGSSIGVTGTVLGVGFGLLFCAYIESIRQALSSLTGTKLFDPEIYFLSHMPSKTDPGEVIAVVAMALALSFLATLYPSWRAANLDPVEALRYE